MRLLADENADAEWISALADGGHDIQTVAETAGLTAGTPDGKLLDRATAASRVLLTADQSDFADPPRADHAGILIIADVTRSGGEIKRGVERVESARFDVSDAVVFLSDWL